MIATQKNIKKKPQPQTQFNSIQSNMYSSKPSWQSQARRHQKTITPSKSSSANYQVPSLMCSTVEDNETYLSSQSTYFSLPSSSAARCVYNASSHNDGGAPPSAHSPSNNASLNHSPMDYASSATSSVASSSYQHSFYSTSAPSVTTICTNTTDNTTTSTTTTSQSPKAYNFRDEPNKKHIVKTELCRSLFESGWCQFGAKCNYAHCESELKYKTLVERDAAKLCNIETHRTRPCFYHVATGDW